MEVGHPVTVPSGAHGIIAAKRKDGVTEVSLIGGDTVRVPFKDLKSYFENPMPGKAMLPDNTQLPVGSLSTRAQIVAILTAAGDQRLSGKEVYARGNFESPVQVYNELFVLYRKHAVIGREKRPTEEGQAVYQYWLIPGAKLPLYGSEKHLAQPGQDSTTPPSHEGHAAGVVPVSSSICGGYDGPRKIVPPGGLLRESVITHGDELISKPELPEAYATVLRDLIAKRDKLNSAITALGLLMEQE